MPITRSELVKQLLKTYPNLLKKDLEKFFNIFIDEIKSALKNNERVELRGWGVFSTKNQKRKTSRNPKTGEKVIVDKKKSIMKIEINELPLALHIFLVVTILFGPVLQGVDVHQFLMCQIGVR